MPNQHPLERPDPSPELFFRRHENGKLGRAPLKELAAELLEMHLDRLLVSHVPAMILSSVSLSTGEVSERKNVVARDDRRRQACLGPTGSNP